ncbi:unnamed protein product [Lathyrus oleraceus]
MATNMNILHCSFAILCIVVILASGEELNYPPIKFEEKYCVYKGPKKCNNDACLLVCVMHRLHGECRQDYCCCHK